MNCKQSLRPETSSDSYVNHLNLQCETWKSIQNRQNDDDAWWKNLANTDIDDKLARKSNNPDVVWVRSIGPNPLSNDRKDIIPMDNLDIQLDYSFRQAYNYRL